MQKETQIVQPSVWRDNLNANFILIHAGKNPIEWKALTPIQQIKNLQDKLKIIWVCQNNEVLKYRGVIENYKLQNINIPDIEVKQISEINQIQFTKYIQTTFQFWFSNEKIYKILSKMMSKVDFKHLKIQYIYFNDKDNNAYLNYKNKKQNQWKDVIQGSHDIIELINNYSQRTAHFNFRYLNQQKLCASIDRMILMALIKHPQTTIELQLERFRILVFQKWGTKYKPQKIQDFIKKFSKQNILKLYSRQSFFYRFLNTFMRITSNPMELFYIQSIVKKMFITIKNLYKVQKNQKKWEQKIYYRGGLIKQKQINKMKSNVGNFVSTFGFLSTSNDLVQAKKFARNALFVIKIKNVQRDQNFDYGYAEIKQFSENPSQNQCIFNPFATLRVESIKEQDKLQVITFVYGQIGQAIYKKANKQVLNKQQQKIYALAVCQNNLLNINNQGDLFMESQYYNIAITYYSKILEQAKRLNIYNSCQAKIRLLQAYVRKQEYIKILQKMSQKNFRQDNQRLIKLQGDAYFGLNIYEQAQRCYNKALSISKYKVKDEKQTNYLNMQVHLYRKILEEQVSPIKLFQSLTKIYLKFQQIKKAQQFSFQALQMSAQIYDFRDQIFVSQLLNHMVIFQQVGRKFIKQTIQVFLNNVLNKNNHQTFIYCCSILSVALYHALSCRANQKQKQIFYKIQQLLQQAQNLYSISGQKFEVEQNAQFFRLKGLLLSFLKKQNAKQAIQSFNMSRKYYEQIKRKIQIAVIDCQIANKYYQLGQIQKAKHKIIPAILTLSQMLRQNKQNKLERYICQYAYQFTQHCLTVEKNLYLKPELCKTIIKCLNIQQKKIKQKYSILYLQCAHIFLQQKMLKQSEQILQKYKTQNFVYTLKQALVEAAILAMKKEYTLSYKILQSAIQNIHIFDQAQKQLKQQALSKCQCYRIQSENKNNQQLIRRTMNILTQKQKLYLIKLQEEQFLR